MANGFYDGMREESRMVPQNAPITFGDMLTILQHPEGLLTGEEYIELRDQIRGVLGLPELERIDEGEEE